MTGQWFSLGTLLSCTNKTDHHNIAEILLKVALSTLTLPPKVPSAKIITCRSNYTYNYST